MIFKLSIDSDNEGVSTPEDVAALVGRTTEAIKASLQSHAHLWEQSPQVAGLVTDVNGNHVGEWSLSDKDSRV